MTCLTLTLFAACGGGGETTLQTAALTGTVTELDGQNVDRSGVAVTLIETGESVMTGLNGRFTFERIPVGAVTLSFQSGARIARQSADDNGKSETENENRNESENEKTETEKKENENENENENQNENEDSRGNPRVHGIESGDSIEVRCSMDDGKVRTFSTSGGNRPRAKSKIERGGLEAEVEVEGGDRQEFEVKAERLAPGTVIDIFLDDPSDAADAAKIASVSARADGEAKYRVRGALPLGARTVADLAGFTVKIVLAETGETLFQLEVPDIGSGVPGSGTGARSRGKARLTAFEAGLEGRVEVRKRPEQGRQRFKMEASNLTAGTAVAFLIEDPQNTGSFIRLAGRTANAFGKAEINTQDGLPTPLGAADVSELVGLEVRVELDDGSATLLLAGSVPPLLTDD